MTNTEAITLLRHNLTFGEDEYSRDKNEAIQRAIEALEKQIPKKPTLDEYCDEICPMCAKFVNDVVSFCPHCGQAIDWSSADD